MKRHYTRRQIQEAIDHQQKQLDEGQYLDSKHLDGVKWLDFNKTEDREAMSSLLDKLSKALSQFGIKVKGKDNSRFQWLLLEYPVSRNYKSFEDTEFYYPGDFIETDRVAFDWKGLDRKTMNEFGIVLDFDYEVDPDYPDYAAKKDYDPMKSTATGKVEVQVIDEAVFKKALGLNLSEAEGNGIQDLTLKSSIIQRIAISFMKRQLASDCNSTMNAIAQIADSKTSVEDAIEIEDSLHA